MSSFADFEFPGQDWSNEGPGRIRGTYNNRGVDRKPMGGPGRVIRLMLYQYRRCKGRYPNVDREARCKYFLISVSSKRHYKIIGESYIIHT